MTGLDLAATLGLFSACSALLGYTIGRIVESDRGLTLMAEYSEGVDAVQSQYRDNVTAQRNRMVAAGKVLREERDALELALDTKQRRVRGVLTEARRWKAIAQSLGWKRETRGEMHARQARESEESK